MRTSTGMNRENSKLFYKTSSKRCKCFINSSTQGWFTHSLTAGFLGGKMHQFRGVPLKHGVAKTFSWTTSGAQLKQPVVKSRALLPAQLTSDASPRTESGDAMQVTAQPAPCQGSCTGGEERSSFFFFFYLDAFIIVFFFKNVQKST